MPISPLPSLDRTAPTFKTDVDTFFGTQLPQFSVQAEAARVEINANTATTTTAKNDALSAASTAAAAASQATSAANFKGLWPSLSGALNKPACVKHNGRFWLLLNNLANVAASEPGVTADWTASDAGIVPSQTLTVAGASVAAVTGVRYILAANDIALTAPTPTLKGEYHGIRKNSGVTGCTWIFGSNKVRGALPGTLAIDIQEQDLYYEDSTQGMV